MVSMSQRDYFQDLLLKLKKKIKTQKIKKTHFRDTHIPFIQVKDKWYKVNVCQTP